MQILENREVWAEHFTKNWLAHYEKTGETDFKQYQYSKNEDAPSGKAIDLSQSKLLFVTSSGAYLKDSQEAFDASNPLGDYTVRTFPLSTPLEDIAFAHEHYNHQYVDQDPQVVLPLRLLEAMQSEGVIGELAETVISFHGYTPDVRRLLDETIPAIMQLAKAQTIDAALLVPVWPVCTQAVSLLNRAFEIDGIPSVMTTWRDGVARLAKAPRVTFTKLPRGATLGAPHDEAQQRRVLNATFDLFKQAAPIEPVILDESLPDKH